jgi:hypothetical protein
MGVTSLKTATFEVFPEAVGLVVEPVCAQADKALATTSPSRKRKDREYRGIRTAPSYDNVVIVCGVRFAQPFMI